VKICVAAVEALRKKEREEYETQFTTKIGGKASLGPSYAYLMPYYAETGCSRPLMT